MLLPWSVEQRRRIGGRRGYEAQVLPARAGGDPAARRPGEQAVPDQERLGDRLDGLRLLPYRDGEGGQANRAAAEPPDQGVEHSPVEAVEAELVHLVQLERGPGELPGDQAVGADLGVVADPAQQAVSDPGRAA